MLTQNQKKRDLLFSGHRAKTSESAEFVLFSKNRHYVQLLWKGFLSVRGVQSVVTGPVIRRTTRCQDVHTIVFRLLDHALYHKLVIIIILKKSSVPARFLLVGASPYEPFAFFLQVFQLTKRRWDLSPLFITYLWLFKDLASMQKNIKWEKKGWFVPEKVCQYIKQ